MNRLRRAWPTPLTAQLLSHPSCQPQVPSSKLLQIPTSVIGLDHGEQAPYCPAFTIRPLVPCPGACQREFSAEKNGVGWEGVYGYDEGAPVSVCVCDLEDEMHLYEQMVCQCQRALKC